MRSCKLTVLAESSSLVISAFLLGMLGVPMPQQQSHIRNGMMIVYYSMLLAD